MSQVKEIIVDILVEEASTIKNIIKEKLNNICVHKWTTDYIDISPELSQKICYCVKCEVTKGEN